MALTGTLAMSLAIGLVACDQPDRVASTSLPTSSCSEVAASFLGCQPFRSVSATEGGGPVEWMHQSPISLKAEDLGGELSLVVTTPCNVLIIPVGIKDGRLITGPTTSTLKGCDAERAAQQRWVEDFFATGVRWQRTDTGLTLSNDRVVVQFVLG